LRHEWRSSSDPVELIALDLTRNIRRRYCIFVSLDF